MKRIRAAIGTGIFFALAPGVVAGAAPWTITRWRTPDTAHPLEVAVGAALVAVAIGALVHLFGRFASEGLGTPAPVAPTERLVVGGLYRHVRNPMYLAVAVAIAGQALAFRSLALVGYGLAVFVAMAAFVRLYEEPTLARRHGQQYEAYRRAVPAWWPRLRPWDPARDGDRPG